MSLAQLKIEDPRIAPTGQYRVVGRCPTGGQYFKDADYSTFLEACERAEFLNGDLCVDEDAPHYSVHNDQGKKVA